MMNWTIRLAIAGAVIVALQLPGTATAAPPWCDDPPCKGGPGEEEGAQNLSVPTIMFGAAVGGLSCGSAEAPSALVPPAGDPLDNYEIDPERYYYVQKLDTWTAQCFFADGANVWGNWGDNLEGDARLKVGSPIRVELVLTNEDEYPDLSTLQGYSVVKLEPSALDRDSAYGHEALGNPIDGFTDDPTDFEQTSWLVHDSGITFSVLNTATGAYAIDPGTSPTAEINATGKVVYGYNLRVGEPGPYRIQFTSSQPIVFLGQDAVNGGQDDDNNVWIDITVTTGGGGGKGNGKGKP